MKKISIAALLLAVLFVVAAAAETTVELPEFSGPYIVTTCGQSPGAVMVGMAGKQAGFVVDYDDAENPLTAGTLDTDVYKTLIVTTGTSMKGMGAAGTDVDIEIARCLKVIEAAKEAGMVVIGAHVEGMSRRVDSTDEASIEAVMAEADIILVIEDSDSDGFFTKYAEEHEKPLLKVANALAVGTVLQ